MVANQFTSGPEPRYRYAKPTPKAQYGKPWTHKEGVGTESSAYMGDYKLPVTDVDRERRNFEGYDKHQYYSEEELYNKVGDTWGTTETDSTSESKHREYGPDGYSKINKRSGGPGRSWKSTSKRS